jgi:cell wall assembly regulator SMI1
MQLVWEPYLNIPSIAPESAIRDVELALGVRFPADYRTILREHQGQTVEPGVFDVGRGTDVLNCLLPAVCEGPYAGYSILRTYADLAQLLPPGIYPICDTPGGNKICLDYRTDPDKPAVVHWDHEQEPQAAISLLASSFAAFLASLHD